MTPISDRLIFIFNVLIKLFIFPLKISFVNICILEAPKVFKSVIFCLSVLIKALYMFIIDVNTVISSVIKIIELVLAPIHIIISGPKDTLGSEFSTVKYGSSIFATVLLLHSILAIIRLMMLAKEKLINVS